MNVATGTHYFDGFEHSNTVNILKGHGCLTTYIMPHDRNSTLNIYRSATWVYTVWNGVHSLFAVSLFAIAALC